MEDSFASDDDVLQGSSVNPFGVKEMSPVFLEQMEDAVSRLKGAVDVSKNIEKDRILSLQDSKRCREGERGRGREGGMKDIDGENLKSSSAGIHDPKSSLKKDVKEGKKKEEEDGKDEAEDEDDCEDGNYNDMSGSQDDEDDAVLVDDNSVSLEEEEVEEEDEIAEERSNYDNEQFDYLESSLEKSQNDDARIQKNIFHKTSIEVVNEVGVEVEDRNTEELPSEHSALNKNVMVFRNESNKGKSDDKQKREEAKKGNKTVLDIQEGERNILHDNDDDDQLDEVEVEVEVGGVDPFCYEKSFDSSVTISWICPDGNAARNLFTEKVRENLNFRENEDENTKLDKTEIFKKYGIASLSDIGSDETGNIKMPLKFQPKIDYGIPAVPVITEIDSDSSQNNVSEGEKQRRKEEKRNAEKTKEEEINYITEAIFMRLIEGEKEAVSVLYNQSSPVHTPSPYSSPCHTPSKATLTLNSLSTYNNYTYENEDSSSDFPYKNNNSHKILREEKDKFIISPECSPEKQQTVETSESVMNLPITPARIIAMLQPLPSSTSASTSTSLCSISAMPSLTHPTVRSPYYSEEMQSSRKELDVDLDDLYGFSDISVTHDNKIVMNKKDESARWAELLHFSTLTFTYLP